MAWGQQQQLDAGAQFGLLYSDIKPEYYGAMGVQAVRITLRVGGAPCR